MRLHCLHLLAFGVSSYRKTDSVLNSCIKELSLTSRLQFVCNIVTYNRLKRSCNFGIPQTDIEKDRNDLPEISLPKVMHEITSQLEILLPKSQPNPKGRSMVVLGVPRANSRITATILSNVIGTNGFNRLEL